MQTKKSFFLKFGIVLCIVACLIGCANYFYVNGYYYRDVYNEVQKFQNVPDHITFANFGTSHGLAAFRYSKEDTSSFNFALSGEDIYHDFQTLKQYADHLEEGCIVTIPVSYFSFCLSTEEPSQKRYYTYLDKQYIRDFSYETLINTKYIPVLRSIEYLFKDLINDQQLNVENFMDEPNSGQDSSAPDVFEAAEEETQNHMITDMPPVDESKIKELNQHAVTRAESWRSGRMVLGQKYMDDNTELLTEMVTYCREKGFVPVMITVPVYRSLREAFSEEELELYYYSNINKVVENTGVEYIDYSVDERLIDNPAYYNNSDHMSAEGGDAFMDFYQADLKAKGFVFD